MASPTPTAAALATTFRSLHVPGHPIVLANIYDAASARAVASLPGSLTKALATASYAVAVSAGYEDADLPLEVNVSAARAAAIVAKEFNLPLTVDFQDGYGDRLEEGIEKLLDLEVVVGINLEDRIKETGVMIPTAEAAERVRRVMKVAKARGVPDFVVNARCDILHVDGSINDAKERGKAYLDAGATSVFVWGGVPRGGITRAEIVELVEAFEGKLNVSLRMNQEGKLGVKELSEIGVARISIGPQLQLIAMKTLAQEAEKLLLARL